MALWLFLRVSAFSARGIAVGLFFGSGSAGLSHSFWGFDELGREKFGLTKKQPQGNPGTADLRVGIRRRLVAVMYGTMRYRIWWVFVVSGVYGFSSDITVAMSRAGTNGNKEGPEVYFWAFGGTLSSDPMQEPYAGNPPVRILSLIHI